MSDPIHSQPVQPLRIGVWEHYFSPEYRIADRLREQFHAEVIPVNFKQPGYLDNLDVLIIEQHGLNDFIENDSEYLHAFVASGKICWIMHQDYERWSTAFLPAELATPWLANRYLTTISPNHKSYLLPWLENPAHPLFAVPNALSSEELLYWKIPGNSFGIQRKSGNAEWLLSAALSCVINPGNWEVLGSFRDAAVPEAALILQARFGKGLFLWNQILFPEIRLPENDPVLRFWDRFIENALCYFEGIVRHGVPVVPSRPAAPRSLSQRTNYRMIAHLHSIDWYGADASLASIHGAMKYHAFDIGILSVKDTLSCLGKRPLEDFCDERVLLLPGQEFHPFNWNPEDALISHNGYHILAAGIQQYSSAFTRSLFSQQEISGYLHKALQYVREQGGASCATHPNTPYWQNFPFDAVDVELKSVAVRQAFHEDKTEVPLLQKTLHGGPVEQFYLSGRHITIMASVDMWGTQRLQENPVFQFIYLNGEPSRAAVVTAIKAGHLMPAIHIREAELTLDGHLPGDTLTVHQARQGSLQVRIEAEKPLSELRLFSHDQLIFREELHGARSLQRILPLERLLLRSFIRLEIEGPEAVLFSNPFYLNATENN